MQRALHLLAWCVALLVAMSCRGGEPPRTAHEDPAERPAMPSASTHVTSMPIDLLLPSMPTGPSITDPPLPPPDERPPCAKDEDCWSLTCCPATAAEQCVHGSLAQKCALIDIKCAKADVHFDCVCVAGQCGGRLPP